ncbi:MAG TPA: S8 family serine peptidase [Verrucomicrobiae bacterium]|nr:S8 family serine peptidase [Verrucomicrobiae bacterium]
MKTRALLWILLCLLCVAGAWLIWQQAGHRPAARPFISREPVHTVHPVSTAPKFLTASNTTTNPVKSATGPAKKDKFANRLHNTNKSLDELIQDDKAILLANALIDTRNPLNFSIPKNLQPTGDPGAYIVQSRQPLNNAFRAMLAAAGATIVSYIPNNAYLVNVTSGGAQTIAGDPMTQAVVPYAPYYKFQGPLPDWAVDQKPLPMDALLNVELFPNNVAATIQQIEKLGGRIVGTDTSPHGTIVRVVPPENWTALGTLAGAEVVELSHKRAAANDLARVTLGVATNTTTAASYMNLSGKNVTVEVNDTGIDATHPDFATGRVLGDAPQSLTDTDGHGTHVAGIIAGNGSMSLSPINVGAVLAAQNFGSVSNAYFGGKATNATLFSVGFLGSDPDVSDSYLQEMPARTNALISNNSWEFVGDDAYDLAAASYDAAVRDALPTVTGSQPVLFVFAAGNNGNGDDDGGGGDADTISSPATAKNVITVGATEQFRNITNVVTNMDGSVSTPWEGMTDSGFQVAGFSSRGNVGIGTEGAFGRYKPDVVAPGTFVVSTRSTEWDTNAYYNPTNDNETATIDLIEPNSSSPLPLQFLVPSNTVSITINAEPNEFSETPLPDLPIYVWPGTDPNSTAPVLVGTNSVSIPPALALNPVGVNWSVAASNTTSRLLIYDLVVDVFTTNDSGNYYQVLQGLNDSMGPYYRFESGTSMAAPSVSGMLALMQDFFTNQWHTVPSPALLKAMLINGSRATGNYDFQVANSINFQGWGMVNLTNALPLGITNQFGAPCSSFVLDQSPTNALATGDSQTFYVTITNVNAQAQPLRVTLAWTDPPGNPVAATKLVNDLNLVVTNLDNNSVVYYGNDIAGGSVFNTPHATNSTPNFDSINNVENVYLSPLLGTNYSVTVIGNRVNVNAVTAQTNNIVQDYALVISCGDGVVSNAMVVMATNPVVASNPTGDQQVTFVTPNSGPVLNQLVGANAPLLSTNALLFTATAPENFGANWQVTIGQTNQWHFYVITNVASTTGAFTNTNAAFATFEPDTLSIPREGVFADSQANATRPEADIDLYVSTDPGLTNLDPNVISNCVISGTQVGASVGLNFANASLGRGGSEVVVDTNSQPNEVYYVGVKSEDQMASEYAFLPIFTATPFSQNQNGIEIVNGQLLPVNIPDGSTAHPGTTNVMGLSLDFRNVGLVVVSNVISHQNFGDLIGSLSHSENQGNGSSSIVLNNHESFDSPLVDQLFVYDDSGQTLGSQPADGPGSLSDFVGQQSFGEWMLTETDDALTQTGSIQNFTLAITPAHKLKQPNDTFFATVTAGGWIYAFIDVPDGATNLNITVTNLTGTVTNLGLYVRFGDLPTTTNFDEMTNIDTPIPPGDTNFTGTISIGLPQLTAGRYFIGVFNPGAVPQDISVSATLQFAFVPAEVDFTSNGSTPILDDAVSTATISVPVNKVISSLEVGIVVEHPRISDLMFHLIAPDGTRTLLMENRGGADTNGAGGMSVDLNSTNYSYLVFTEDTNKTTTPIKFAVPPFVPGSNSIVWQNGFEGNTLANPINAGSFFSGGWRVDSGNVEDFRYDDFDAGPAYEGDYLLDINGTIPGAISTNIATVPGTTYVLNFGYTRNPDTVAANVVPMINVLMGGNLLATLATTYTNSWANLDWQTAAYSFTATSTSTLLQIQSTNTPGASGVFLDGFSLGIPSGDLFYLPEQSLDALDGENSQGNWTLEIQDDRAGAGLTNTLASWQLRFNFTTAVGAITNGTPITNSIPPNSIDYYLVHVPTNADLATNFLFTTSGPLNFWFNQTTLPSGTGAPGDSLLFTTSTNNFTVLSTTSTPTNIVPGGTYYLAVQNTNAFAITNYSVQVTFDLLPTVPITNWPVSGITFTNIGGTNGILLTWYAPSNYQFQVQWTTSLSPAPISWTTIPGLLLSPVALTPTNGIFQFFDDGSLTGGFGPIKFYRLIAYPPGVAVPPSFVVNGIEALPTGGFQIQWTGSTNYNYEVLWTTNLALPTASWQILTNLNSPPLTLGVSNSVFTLDTGALTTGAASAFFQVIELP